MIPHRAHEALGGCLHIENCGTRADAALKITHEAIRSVEGKIVSGSDAPRTLPALAGFHRVRVHEFGRVALTYLKHCDFAPRVEERQDDRAGRRVDRRVNVQIIGQSTRWADDLFLSRQAYHPWLGPLKEALGDALTRYRE